MCGGLSCAIVGCHGNGNYCSSSMVCWMLIHSHWRIPRWFEWTFHPKVHQDQHLCTDSDVSFSSVICFSWMSFLLEFALYTTEAHLPGASLQRAPIHVWVVYVLWIPEPAQVAPWHCGYTDATFKIENPPVFCACVVGSTVRAQH